MTMLKIIVEPHEKIGPSHTSGRGMSEVKIFQVLCTDLEKRKSAK